MYRYEFKEDDLFINRIKTYPEYNIFIYQGRHYINREQATSGSASGSIKGRKRDGLQVFDINSNRTDHLVKPFIRTSARLDDWKFRLYNPMIKNTADGGIFAGGNAFEASQNSYTIPANLYHSTAYSGSVPITRTLTTAVSTKTKRIFNRSTGTSSVETITYKRPTNLTASVLVNVAKKYSHLSKHFNLLGQDHTLNGFNGISASSGVTIDRNMCRETVNMIFIPQMYYGSTIKKGSVYLNYYYTGSMMAACHDKNANGELIGTSGSTAGAVVGIVLYDEGIIMLTSSKDLDSGRNVRYTGDPVSGSWLYYGTTLNDGIAIDNVGVGNASYELDFKGTSYLTSMTMFAKAQKGHLNHSNNPTYRDLSDPIVATTGKGPIFSEGYSEIDNVTSASYVSASFEKTTYISKVGIYDENRNLIGIASVSKPVKKKPELGYTFKLKMDF